MEEIKGERLGENGNIILIFEEKLNPISMSSTCAQVLQTVVDLEQFDKSKTTRAVAIELRR